MTRLLLYKEGKSLLGMDAVMYVDGRLNIHNIKNKVEKRNAKYIKNFPHLICDSFMYAGKYGQKINLTNKIIKL